MMLEMEKVEPQIFHVTNPTAEENGENDEDEPKLTREELIERSRELRHLRIRESQRSAKAHRQNKIKSKKYHRILKKEKMKQQIKEFELLQKTDPEAALRKIEQLDRTRVEERANLRHRNTGTWAKNLQVRAKYDKDARKDLADQIAISRELTAKKQSIDSDDENDEDGADVGVGNESDPFNPWIVSSDKTNGASKSNEIGEFLSGYRKYWQERNQNQQDMVDYKSDNVPEIHSQHEESDDSKDESEPEQLQLAENAQSKHKNRFKKVKSIAVKSKSRKKSKLNAGWFEEDISDAPKSGSKKKNKNQKKNKATIVDSIDDLFDDAEEAMLEKFKNKYSKLKSELASNKSNRKNASRDEDDDDASDQESQPIDLGFKKQIKRPNVDEALNGDGDDDVGDAEGLLSKRITKALNSVKSNDNAASLNANGIVDNHESENINPNDIAKVKSQHLSTAIPDTVYSVADDGFDEYDDEYHFDDEKKMTIAEAFEDDDIVAEFKREKDDEEKKNGPQEIDMTLPGWGSWGGSGINPSKQKAKRKLILRELVKIYRTMFDDKFIHFN